MPEEGPQIFKIPWTYAELQQYKWTFIKGFILGLITASAVVIEIYLILSVKKPSQRFFHDTIYFIIVTLTALLTIAIPFKIATHWFNQIINYINKNIDTSHRGYKGEEDVAPIILNSLNKNWSIYFNLVIPPTKKGEIFWDAFKKYIHQKTPLWKKLYKKIKIKNISLAEIDTILIGPQGILLLEIKNLTDKYRYINYKWQYQKGEKWITPHKNPIKQAKRNAAQLQEFLQEDGIEWVNPYIVWANNENLPELDQHNTIVWTIDILQNELTKISQSTEIKLNPEQLNKINGKMVTLYQQQKEKTYKS